MKSLRLLALVVGSLAIAACSSSSNNNDNALGNPIPATGIVQFHHAVADAPTVDIVVDGVTRFAGVDYKQASDFVALLPGTYPVEVLANLPDGTNLPVLAANVTITADTLTSVTVVGSVFAGLDTIDAIILDQPRTAVAADSARLSVIHAFFGEGGSAPVNLYIALPDDPDGTDLSGTGVLDFGDAATLPDVPEGTYRIRIRLAPEGDVLGLLIYEKEVALSDGDNLRVAAVANTSGGDAALTLMAIGGSGSADLLDDDTPAFVRIGHLSVDAPEVAVNLDELVEDDEGDLVPSGNPFTLTTLAFPGFFPPFDGWADVDPASFDVEIATTDDPPAVVLPGVDDDPISLTLDAGTATQVLAINTAENLELLVAAGPVPRAVATGAYLRLFHAATLEAAAEVDVYLFEAGTGTTTVDGVTTINEGAEAVLEVPGFAFGTATDYVYIASDSYDVCITVADMMECVLFEFLGTVDAGLVASIYAFDDGEGGVTADGIIDNVGIFID